MLTSHAVQSLCFELRADSAAQAHGLGDRLSALCQQQLVAVLAEELSAHCPADQHLHLPRLVLELPPVASRRLEADLPDLLRHALRAALAQASGAPTAAAAVAADLAVLTILEYFLRHGRLPWQINAARFSLREAFQTALTQHAAAFRTLVVQLGRTAAVRQRLVWQLSSAQLDQLITLLQPTHAAFLRDYILTTLAAHRREPLAPVTETALRGILYELVLTDLLTHTSSVFNRRAFVERQVHQLAARYSLSFGLLLRQLVSLAPAVVPFAAQSALPMLLRALYQEHVHGQRAAAFPLAAAGSHSLVISPAAKQGEAAELAKPAEMYTPASDAAPAAPAEAVAYFLRFGSLPAVGAALTPDQLSTGLTALLAQGWPALRTVLRAAGPAAPSRLTRFFPEALLQQVLRRAVPGQVRPWLSILATTEQQAASPGRPRVARHDVWAQALHYLIQADGQVPSSPAFQRWLQQQLPDAEPRGRFRVSPPRFDSTMASNNLTPAPGRPEQARQSFGRSLVQQQHSGAGPGKQQASRTRQGLTRAEKQPIDYAQGPQPGQLGERLTPRADYYGQATTEQQLSEQALVRQPGDAPPWGEQRPDQQPGANQNRPDQAWEMVEHYLTHGQLPTTGTSPGPDALRARLEQIIRYQPQRLREWLRRPASATADVLLRLVRLADFALLSGLLANARPHRARTRHRHQLLASLDFFRPAHARFGAPVQLAEFLRAAYVAFHLPPGSSAPFGPARQLAAAYRLPWRAILRKATDLAQLYPALALEPFFASLLAEAHGTVPLPVFEPEATTATPAQPAPGTILRHSREPGSVASSSAPGPGVTGPGRPRILPGLADSLRRQPAQDASRLAAVLFGPVFWDGSASAENLTQTGRATASQPFLLRPGSVLPMLAVPSLGPRAHRWPLARPRLVYEQAPAAAPGIQARELLFYYLLHGALPVWGRQPAPTAQPRKWLAQVARQQPAQLLTFLRQHAATSPVSARLAHLADLPTLAQLLTFRSGRVPRAAAALAALDRREAAGKAQPSSWLLFLRSAYLSFHLQPRLPAAGARQREAQRLAAAHGLPWQALLKKIERLLDQQPLLRSDVFFASFPASTPIRKTPPKPAKKLASTSNPPRPAGASTGRPPAENPVFRATTPPFSTGTAPAFTAIQEPGQPLTQLPTGVAARDLAIHLLLHPDLPWWAPQGFTQAQQRQLVTQVAHYYRAELVALVRAHHREPAFRRRLAGLTGFAQLHQLTAGATSSARGPAPGAAALLSRLDQVLGPASQDAGLYFLRQAYLAFRTQPGPVSPPLLATEVRRQASAAGVAWRTVVLRLTGLQRQLPTLAALPFFAALLAEAADQPNRLGRRARAANRPTQPTTPAGAAAPPPDAATVYQQLDHYLQTGQAPPDMAPGPNPAQPAGSSASGAFAQGEAGFWHLLLRPEHRASLQRVRPLLASATVRGRLLAGLSEKASWQLLQQLFPAHYRLVRPLVADWQLLAAQGIVHLRAPGLFEVLLELLQTTPVASWRADTLVGALLRAEEQLWPQLARLRDQSRPGRIMAEAMRRGLGLRSSLPALLTLRYETLTAARKIPPPSAPIPFTTEENTPLETVYITNAGLVLLWPFLTMLFDRLGLLEDQQFRDEEAQQRAVLLLQFLASGVQDIPEYELPLNKLLCALAQSRPLPRTLSLTPDEQDVALSLLRAVIARWEVLKNTSVAGLRETFLLRPGKLEWLADRIVLTVETKTLDILLDQRPWSISIIKLPWMAAPLYVTWR